VTSSNGYVSFEDPPEVAEEVRQPRRAVDRDRELAAAERERLQHPRQAEEVVGVEVGEEDLLELDQPDGGAQHLALRALTAVEEELVAAAPHQERARRALRCRHRAARPEEHDVEVHCARGYGSPARGGDPGAVR